MLKHSFTASRVLVATLAVTGAVAASSAASAQQQVSARRSGGDDSGGTYRSVLVGLPVVTDERGLTAHLELNLYGRAAVALEGTMGSKGQDLDKSEIKTSGESLQTQGKSLTLYLNKYSHGYSMSGFYYGLGVGYRQEDIDWRQRTSPAGISLADSTYATHDVRLQGATGHARLGYRYVGTDYPLLVGAYGGIRHFQASASDRTSGSTDANPITPTTDKDKQHLQNRFATEPELGIEVGFVF